MPDSSSNAFQQLLLNGIAPVDQAWTFADDFDASVADPASRGPNDDSSGNSTSTSNGQPWTFSDDFDAAPDDATSNASATDAADDNNDSNGEADDASDESDESDDSSDDSSNDDQADSTPVA